MSQARLLLATSGVLGVFACNDMDEPAGNAELVATTPARLEAINWHSGRRYRARVRGSYFISQQDQRRVHECARQNKTMQREIGRIAELDSRLDAASVLASEKGLSPDLQIALDDLRLKYETTHIAICDPRQFRDAISGYEDRLENLGQIITEES